MFFVNLMLISSIVIIVIWLYIKWHKMKMFWIKKGIPQCEVHPILGSLTFLQKINPGTWMANVYNQYPHPYVGIWVFWRPGLIINCPNLAHKILVRDSDNFRNRLLGTGKTDKLGTLNIFTANQRVYEELKGVKNKIGDKELQASDLSELPFFNAVIKEALRKYPIMGWLDRTSLKEYQVDEHLTIPAGTVVYVNSNGMHQDPQIFPDPMEFKPERFLPENMQTFIPYAYLPFGGGPRSCLGTLFAMFSMRFGFSAVISNFILEPLPNAPAPNDVTVQKKGLFYGPGEVLSVKFVPRSECLF